MTFFWVGMAVFFLGQKAPSAKRCIKIGGPTVGTFVFGAESESTERQKVH